MPAWTRSDVGLSLSRDSAPAAGTRDISVSSALFTL